MSAAITIEDLLGAEGWDDAAHPSRLAAETEYLLAEAMQVVLLNMRVRLRRAGAPESGNDALAVERAFDEAQRGLNYLSLIQSRLVRTYRADPGFDEARAEAPVTHRDRLRDIAAAAIEAAGRSETKTRQDGAAAFDARMGRILAEMEPRNDYHDRHILETEARLRRHEPDWPSLESAMAEFDEAELAGDISAFVVRANSEDMSVSANGEGKTTADYKSGNAEKTAQTALRIPADGENDEIALRIDEELPDDLETKSAVPGLEYSAVVPWGWRPPQRPRGRQPGNRNRLKSGRFTAESRARRAQSRAFRRGLRELGALVKQVIALRAEASKADRRQDSTPPGTAPP